jgi:hypothetical protein
MVFEAVCPPRSTVTEIPPGNVGLSPMAGQDVNKAATAAVEKAEAKLAQTAAQDAYCQTAGPAAGKTHAEILQQLHAMTDSIVSAGQQLAAWETKLDGTRSEISALEAEEQRLRYALSARVNSHLPDGGEVLTAAERKALVSQLDATSKALTQVQTRLRAELDQRDVLRADRNRRTGERDRLMDDAMRRKEVNGRYCGP